MESGRTDHFRDTYSLPPRKVPVPNWILEKSACPKLDSQIGFLIAFRPCQIGALVGGLGAE